MGREREGERGFKQRAKEKDPDGKEANLREIEQDPMHILGGGTQR